MEGESDEEFSYPSDYSDEEIGYPIEYSDIDATVNFIRNNTKTRKGLNPAYEIDEASFCDVSFAGGDFVENTLTTGGVISRIDMITLAMLTKAGVLKWNSSGNWWTNAVKWMISTESQGVSSWGGYVLYQTTHGRLYRTEQAQDTIKYSAPKEVTSNVVDIALLRLVDWWTHHGYAGYITATVQPTYEPVKGELNSNGDPATVITMQ